MDNYLEEKTLSIIIWKIIARIHLRILFLSKLLPFSCDIHEISAIYQEWFHCQIPWMAIVRNSQHPPLFILIVIENELHDFLFWSFRKRICRHNAVTLSEAETLQGQIIQCSPLLIKGWIGVMHQVGPLKMNQDYINR